MNDDQKRTFLFVLIAGLTLFGWQMYFAPEQTFVTPEVKKTVENKQATQPVQQNTTTAEEVKNVETSEVTSVTQIEDKVVTVSNGEHVLSFDSFLNVKDFTNSEIKFPLSETLGKTTTRFKVQVAKAGTRNYRDLQFNFEDVNQNIVKGFDPVNKVNLALTLGERGKAYIKLTSAESLVFRTFFGAADSSKEEHETNNRMVRQFLYFSKDVERISVGDDSTGEGSVKWAGVDYNYHLFALIFKNKPKTLYKVFETGEYYVETTSATNSFEGELIYAKKDYDSLIALGDKLELSVDFGFFGILSVPILRGLQFFYKFVGNYGLAIIILTIVIRMLTFPFQYKSFKSMKKMQKVQPELQRLREKYKDDPARMQKETMALFKKSGANPIGGCLPMILQMPVFFAFYQVLYNAVELVGAPFYFWIFDLSHKDPYYVLPVLMGAAMFGQTKLNPSASADPTQQKVMLFMPLIFCFIMKDLPAGLNLYIFISTIFGIAQQLFVYKTVD
ncbi:membrane protein insertase YidC [Halobacteriovorax sp. GB3]|uniref:membrane protein insertase YidC n=1 Tax=Halobacteriovorax sp. GB3 TaxID=2719615 RepID=UPI00235F050A|nr:membrane protein insertase YidC [Halobacteriovorax sp. GB3]MDD0854732.1 membrane protein insertase YidC [Halobacteriovorax sp. GB3]